MGSVVPKGAYIDDSISRQLLSLSLCFVQSSRKISAVYIFFGFGVLRRTVCFTAQEDANWISETHLDNSASLSL